MPADPHSTASATPAPAVAAVVVTHDPGPWFEECLEALAGQDYPNLSLIVVDAGSVEDPAERVVRSVPNAYVRRLESSVGFGAAVNVALALVEGASHFLICHDDVAPSPDAVRLLIEESFRSNAGVASPKYVEWDRSDRLVAVGATTDWAGTVRGLIEPGELDQAQHDRVREILVAPGGMTLVRADLFNALGGFTAHGDGDGEDLDLSWRARLLGARLIVVPAATVRHMRASQSDRRSGLGAKERPRDERRRRAEQNRYRTVLTCYRWFNLAWTLPLAWIWATLEALMLALRGRGDEAWATLTAPFLAFRRPGDLLRSRRTVQGSRRVGDGALRSLQANTAGQVTAFVRARAEHLGVGGRHEGVSSKLQAREDPPQSSRSGGFAGRAMLLALGLVVLAFGSRNILGHGLPQIGDLPTTSAGWASIWGSWWSGWQPSGLGVAAPATPALALIGLVATVVFGAMGTLAQLLALAPLVIGPFGAYRGARWWGSKRGQVLGALSYAIVPLAYNSLSQGSWAGLVAYAAAPWVLSRIVELSAAIPVAPGRSAHLTAKVLALGALIGATASVAPSFFYVVLVIGAGLIIGTVVAGQRAIALRMAWTTAASVVAGFVMTLPWSATVIASSTAVGGPGLGSAGRLGWTAVLRFNTGPYGSGAWEWLILVAASFVLVLGRNWRLDWAARLWVLALACFAVAWAGTRGLFPHLPAEVILAPAAAALANAVALGAASFEIDLPGYRFGWRQAAAGVAVACLALGGVPFVVASAGGHWDMPSGGASSALAFLPSSKHGDYRVLWVGSPVALPLASRPLEPGFAYGTSFDGAPSLANDFATGSSGASGVLAYDLEVAQQQMTTSLGHLLAPAGIRYIVIPNHTGPSGSTSRAVPIPNALLAGLGLQTDLSPLDVGDTHYQVYENSAWSPVRSMLPANAVSVATSAAGSSALQSARILQRTDISTAAPVLRGGGYGASGTLRSGGLLYVGYTRSGNWTLDVAGRKLTPESAFGWAMAFNLPSGPDSSSTAQLRYETPWTLRVLQVAQLALWLAVGLAIVDSRRRRKRDGTAASVAPAEWFEPVQAPGARRRPARSRRQIPEALDIDEQGWVDG